MRVCKPLLVVAVLLLAACAPKMPDMGDAFKTKYLDLTADFFTKVNGRFVNPLGNYLEFDRKEKTMTRVIADGTESVLVDEEVKKCGPKDQNCFCAEKSCSKTLVKPLPCSNEITSKIMSVMAYKGLLVEGKKIVAKPIEIRTVYSDPKVEAAVANELGSTNEILKSYCEKLSQGLVVGKGFRYEIISYDKSKIHTGSVGLFVEGSPAESLRENGWMENRIFTKVE